MRTLVVGIITLLSAIASTTDAQNYSYYVNQAKRFYMDAQTYYNQSKVCQREAQYFYKQSKSYAKDVAYYSQCRDSVKASKCHNAAKNAYANYLQRMQSAQGALAYARLRMQWYRDALKGCLPRG